MDKYRVTIGGHEYRIEIDGERVWIDGQPAYIGIHFLNENGLFMVEKDSGKREYHLKPQDDGSYRVTTRGLQVEAQIEPEKGAARKRAARKARKMPAGSKRPSRRGDGSASSRGRQRGAQPGAGGVGIHENADGIPRAFAGVVENVSISKGQKLEKGDEMVHIRKTD
jgi:biotin carboxyl carrier protein